MNLICNNCVGARFYTIMGWQFTNPFMWASILPADFVKLVNDFDHLDLTDVSFDLEKWMKNDYYTVVATLSNGVKVHFIHYIQDDGKNGHKIEIDDSTNILDADILAFAREKWFTRLSRMTEKPIFLFSFNYCKPERKSVYMSALKNLLSIKKDKLCILVHECINIDSKQVSKNIKIVWCKSNVMNLNGAELCHALKNNILSLESF